MCPEGKVGLHVCAVLFSLRGWLRKRQPERTGGVLSFELLGVQLFCFALKAAHGSSR